MTIEAREFDFLAELVRERSGIYLTQEKILLLETRLLPLLRRHKYNNIPDLVASIQRESSEEICTEIVEAVTTNETSFFRDQKVFDYLRSTVFSHIASRTPSQKIRVWSAAASSGQEAYSLAMLLAEQKAAEKNYEVEIIATDIDRGVLRKAEQGVYSQFEVQRGLPITLLLKYFISEGEHWRVCPQLKKKIQFHPANLLKKNLYLGLFDIILCRNVLIYFSAETKKQVLQNLSYSMKKKGFLIVGSSEVISDPAFQAVTGYPGIYRW